jgi:holo-[acyl-carrier protein] synthase
MPAEATPGGRLAVLVGADLVSIGKVASKLATQPALAREVFTEREMRYARARRRGDEHLAATLAAKEAVFKALGTGLAQGVDWHDVEVVKAASGRPRIRLTGTAISIADRLGVQSMEISLSHSAGLAVAFAAALCLRQPCPAGPAGRADRAGGPP